MGRHERSQGRSKVADRNAIYTTFHPFDGCDADSSGRHSTRNLSQEGFVKTTNPNNPGQAGREKPGNQSGKPGQSGQVGKPGQGGQGRREGNPFPPRPDNEGDYGQGGPDSDEVDR